MAVRMFVRHQVADYDAWRKVYDDFGPDQKALGVVAESVYQSADDPQDITVTHDFDNIEQARAFVDSEDLKSAMARAGVAGPPTIWFTSEV